MLAKRFAIAITFAALGPLIGALAILGVAFLYAAGRAGPVAGADDILLVIGFGYIIGIGPALLAGIAYAASHGVFQRVLLAPLYGIAATWLFFKVVSNLDEDLRLLARGDPILLSIGALAALICAIIARIAGWTPAHGALQEAHHG